MGKLFDQIREAVEEGRYLIGVHAGNQLDERGIPDWQVVAGLDEGVLRIERPSAQPNPVVEVEELLPDGTTVNAVWSWLPHHRAAKLVTVHYFDR
ncbi:MAG TPA: hypothetical protein VJZ71_13240 [Phycisphaerae bacterium]|nr:hypothetical protein [Phycisphaerae bacterium]